MSKICLGADFPKFRSAVGFDVRQRSNHQIRPLISRKSLSEVAGCFARDLQRHILEPQDHLLCVHGSGFQRVLPLWLVNPFTNLCTNWRACFSDLYLSSVMIFTLSGHCYDDRLGSWSNGGQFCALCSNLQGGAERDLQFYWITQNFKRTFWLPLRILYFLLKCTGCNCSTCNHVSSWDRR